MQKVKPVRSVLFDKNMNLILQSDPVFEMLFPDIKTLTVFSDFLSKNAMLDDTFLMKLVIKGVNHHVCYKGIDHDETYEFQFFLLDEEWVVINPTGKHDIKDQLTGLLTERSVLSLIDNGIQRSQRDKDSYTVLLIDIAHLKDINEAFGFLAGDSIIHSISQVLHTNTRAADSLGRYKGDKFIVFLHKTDINGAMQYIKKFESALKKIKFTFEDLNFYVKTHYGIANNHEDETIDLLIQRLHSTLLEAKKDSTSHIEYFT